MAGPGIRYYYIAKILGRNFDVTLATHAPTPKNSRLPEVSYIDPKTDEYKKLFDSSDIIFAQWLSSEMTEYVRGKKIIIFDLYAPVPIEYLSSLKFSSTKNIDSKDEEFFAIIEMYKNYLKVGNYFVCSNERQRDFWIGFSVSSGIIKPSNIRLESDIYDRFGIVPMGTAKESPVKKGKLRNRFGFKSDDLVLVWTGGIWDWFDAVPIIEAIPKIHNNKVKLVFLGIKHPNKNVPEMNATSEAIKIANKLNLTNSSVFFMEDWIPYSKRDEYLVDADVAIYCDKYSSETRFSHRTRVLDHIWTDLPTICPPGDIFSEIIKTRQLGIVTKDRTSRSFADAIKEIMDVNLLNNIRENIHNEAHKFTWDNTTEDLVKFIDSVKPGENRNFKNDTLRTDNQTISVVNNSRVSSIKNKIIKIIHST